MLLDLKMVESSLKSLKAVDKDRMAHYSFCGPIKDVGDIIQDMENYPTLALIEDNGKHIFTAVDEDGNDLSGAFTIFIVLK